MNESEPKKDHSVKPKPEQEQTVGLTQVGTLHGELPDADGSIANLREQVENLKLERDEAKVAADFANLESELAHLRQENAELKLDAVANITSLNECGKLLQRHKADLDKCREALLNIISPYSAEEIAEMRTRHGGCSAGELCLRDVIMVYDALLICESPKQLPTQDPATAIAYGLYPSSARPVNPNPSKSENWVGYTPIDPQTK